MAFAQHGYENSVTSRGGVAVEDLAGMVLTFFAGLSVEQNLKSSRAATGRKVDNLMRVLRRMAEQTEV